ncbi:MAG: hypothetical protein AB2693_06330, partial [Candidatus Thiodiazotropha sp.]
VMWFCPDDCMKKAESYFSGPDSSSFMALNNKIDMLIKNFSELKLAETHKEEILDKKIENKVKEILQDQKELEYRKCNLIAFRVKELSETASREENFNNDSLVLNDIMNELKVESPITNIVRHGKEQRGKTRPLQFTVKDVQTKNEILKRAKALKNSNDMRLKEIFIVPDRTPKQREELKVKLREVKERRDKGENVALINGMIRSFPGKPNNGVDSHRPQESARLFPGKSTTREDSEGRRSGADGGGPREGSRPTAR